MSREGIMLCYPFEVKRFQKWNNQAFIQPKLDGDRCRAIKTLYGVDLISSEGNRITMLPHINKALESLPSFPPGMELDGELYTHGMSLEEIGSRVKRTANPHPCAKDIEYHIFDLVKEAPQAERFKELITLSPNPAGPIHLVRPKVVESVEEIERSSEQYLSDGYEGFILRHIAAPYLRRRSIYMMKFKPKRIDIYLIVGWKEEVSIHKELKGTLGALILDAGYGNGTTFDVGSGFTKNQRRELWLIKESLIGKQCQVSYQNLTSAKGVPRHSVFMTVLEFKEGL